MCIIRYRIKKHVEYFDGLLGIDNQILKLSTNQLRQNSIY